MWHHLLLLLSALLSLTPTQVGCELHPVDTSETFIKLTTDIQRPLGVFYYTHDGGEFQSKTHRVMAAVDLRMNDFPFRFLDLAEVNCASESITRESVPACANNRRQFLVYMPTVKEPEKFSLRTLYDTDAFIAEMVFHIYSDHLHMVYSKAKLDELVNQSRGDRDVVFTQFDLLGSADHYEFMHLYLRNLDKYIYAFSTDVQVARDLGKKEDDYRTGLWLFRCKERECEMETHMETSTIDAETMERHLNTKNLPPVSRMTKQGTTIYDGEGDGVFRMVFLLVETEKQAEEMTDMLSSAVRIALDDGIQARGVILDLVTHGAIMKKEFGVHLAAQLPTVAMEYVEDHQSGRRTYQGGSNVATELMLPGEEVNDVNVAKFVYRIAIKGEEHHAAVAERYHIYCVGDEEWSQMKKYNHNSLLAVCTKDPDNTNGCTTLKRHFRRLVRTLTTFEPSINMDFVYLQKIENFTKPSFVLNLDGKVFETMQVDSYASILSWLNTHMNTKLVVLVPSGGDSLPLPSHSKYDENKEIQYGEEELSYYQEDEIAIAAQKLRQERFYSDQTPSLTDENFDQSVKESQLMLAFFYMPAIDDISFLTEPVIDGVRRKVEEMDDLKDVKVAKINCENQHRACSKANIHTFPLIRFYSQGKVIGTYKGVLEHDRILQALVSYKNPTQQQKEGEKNTLPTFGEITIDNFLTYKSLNKSLLVAFARASSKTNSTAWNAVSRLSKEDMKVKDVVAAWMNLETEVGRDIRRSYLGMLKESTQGDIVFVNFKKAEVYHYLPEQMENIKTETKSETDTEIETETKTESETKVADDVLRTWVRKCAAGSVKATKYLNVLKFKPLREGFDFLTLIDANLRYPGDKGKEHDGEEVDDGEEDGHGPRRRFPQLAEKQVDGDNNSGLDIDEGIEISDNVIRRHEEL